MNLKRLVVFHIIFLMVQPVFSQQVKVGLFNEHVVKSAVFSPVSGKYLLEADGQSITYLPVGAILYFTSWGDSIHLRLKDGHVGTYGKIHFKSLSDYASFKLKPVEPILQSRAYDDDLSATFSVNKLQLTNVVKMQKYLTGVVQAEGGSTAHERFYQVQAILARTYAYRNRFRHAGEGFNLCDGVHCQAFKGSAIHHAKILKACRDTRDIILVDTSGNPITSAFHSHCGGQTNNSEDVWLSAKPYLVSVNDPYCSATRHSSWKHEIPLSAWEAYLKGNGYSTKGYLPHDYNFQQIKRAKYYQVENIKIPLRKIRSDWGLRSTFFSVKTRGNRLIFQGKGFGHGVGLCQHGAMKMARLGYSYREIIHFYFKNVELINIKTSGFFFSQDNEPGLDFTR